MTTRGVYVIRGPNRNTPSWQGWCAERQRFDGVVVLGLVTGLHRDYHSTTEPAPNNKCFTLRHLDFYGDWLYPLELPHDREAIAAALYDIVVYDTTVRVFTKYLQGAFFSSFAPSLEDRLPREEWLSTTNRVTPA